MAPASIFEQIVDHANRADPYRLYAALREEPVRREADGTYVVSTYDAIVALLHDPRISSAERTRRGDGRPDDGDGPDERGLPGFILLDPPEHDRVRRILMRHFGPPHTPGRIDGMRADIRAIVTALIDGFAGRDQLDLVDDFSYPFPVTVICQLLGVPREDEPRFRGWNEAILEGIGPSGAELPEVADKRRQAFAALGDYLGELADAHRREPGDDLLSALVTDDGSTSSEGGGHVTAAGERRTLTRPELLSNASLLLFAGHETTVNLITNGMLTLLRHRDVLDRLRREPELAPRLVEELLRYEPPVHFLPSRTALADIDVAGTTIPAGSPVTLALAAGSRDPAHVRDPDRFDPDRYDSEGDQHLGFGGGVHYCFGAPLARLETQIALVELAHRLEHPRLLADPPPYRPNAVLRGPRHLPLAIDGVATAGRPGVPRPREAAPDRDRVTGA